MVREAGRRALRMRHFDVQLIGGMVLHGGRIAEMKTGEGKTLVATLPAYLNALGGKGVHVVTVNDYLARRDAEWMGRIYRFLGLSVGVIQHDLDDADRKAAYASDITYGTNNEFGFDYLRDNMKFELAQYVQRGHHFAIVDEVDSILIDEARTPLIISGPAEESTDLYYEIDRIIPRLKLGAVTQGQVKAEEREALETTGDYIVDEKHKTVQLTEGGMAAAEAALAHRMQAGGLYDPANMPLLHHMQQGLRAHALFKLDVDYVVKDGQVVIVDEFTGRLMPGRRWSDGLHQAVEAKEKVKIERENQTLATITLQNYFRMYTEALRHDRHGRHRGRGIRQDLQARRGGRADQPPADPHRGAGPRLQDAKPRSSRRSSPTCSSSRSRAAPCWSAPSRSRSRSGCPACCSRRGVKHVVLNAKYHAQEAEIVAQAGRMATVTVATNMAGRGTDILLGGNAEFMARQQALGDEAAERQPKSEARFVDDDEFVYFFHIDSFYRVPRAVFEPIFASAQGTVRHRARRRRRRRRPAHRRHRAARVAAHRQPAARPRRPPGRSRLVALLPLARRRPDAHLRHPPTSAG